jgi:short-subunit dehydrogenase
MTKLSVSMKSPFNTTFFSIDTREGESVLPGSIRSAASALMHPVAFIIGAGSNVGFTVARRFLKEGYKVAVGSRKPDVDDAHKIGFVPVTIDVSEQATITAAFTEVEKELGPANVVVYNGTLSLPYVELNTDLSISRQSLSLSQAR